MENDSRDQSFQHSLFSEFDFLHYDIENEVLFCKTSDRYSYNTLFLMLGWKSKEEDTGTIGAN